MARLFKRKGCKNWFMSFTEHGVQRCEATHTTNRRLAQKILDARLGAIAEGRQPFPLIRSDGPRLKAWTDKFLESIPNTETKRRYTSSVRNLVGYFGDQARLSEITPGRIEEFNQARLKEEVSPASINRDLATARLFLKRAARQRFIGRSPFADDQIDFLEERKSRRRPRIITFQEEQKLLSAATPLLRALVVLLLETGLRVGKEALPLKWTDVDFADGIINVWQSKTLAGRRIVYMSKLCMAELLRWKNLMGPDFSPYVFPNPSNQRIHLKGVRKLWVKALIDAKIEYFRIYDLRANFASRLSAAGAPDNLVAGVIGHASTSIVQTHAKVVDEYRRDAIRKLEAYRNEQQEKLASTSASPKTPEPTKSTPMM
jgi:integrase